MHYCTILSGQAVGFFLLEGKVFRFQAEVPVSADDRCGTGRTAYKIKGVEIVLEVGQVAASDVGWQSFGMQPQTIGKLIDSFNRLGMLTTQTNNRTSVHSLHFLTGWYVWGVLITNPHYVRPSATAKGQTGDVRTPVSDGSPSAGGQDAVPDESQSGGQEADNMATTQQSFLLPSVRLKLPARQPTDRMMTAIIHRLICGRQTKPGISCHERWGQTAADRNGAESSKGAERNDWR